jgi:diaminopimelate decarboxylase
MALTDVFPQNWTTADGRASIAGVDLADLADRHGTPVFVADVAHIKDRLAAFAAALGPAGTPAYAAKAFTCVAMAELIAETDWWIDVVSIGEAEAARRGGIPPDRIMLHGNLKTPEETELVLSGQVGRVVIDSLDELRRLDCLVDEREVDVDVLIRLNEDLELATHPKVLTTGDEAKFGLIAEEAAVAAWLLAESARLHWRGVHLHMGSQADNVDLYTVVLERLVAFAERHRTALEGEIILDIGGGMAAPYLADDPILQPAELGEALRASAIALRIEERLGAHRLVIEPGRAVVANAMVTLYRVGVRKPLPQGGELVAVDGGMTDNPRPALYGSRYEVAAVTRMDEAADHPVRLFGRMCETDVLLPSVGVPAGLAVGDVVAIAATGAYTYSMSSRYNLLRRPPVVFVEDGRATEVVRRESVADLFTGDLGLSGIASQQYDPNQSNNEPEV